MPDSRENILVLLNAAEGLLQVGLAIRNEMVAWRECDAAGQGADKLIPTLASLLDETGLDRAQINRIACVRGPGSFTGIRLALTTAFGLSRAIIGPNGQSPCLAGLDYLPLLAASALLNPTNLPDKPVALWVLTHARRGQVNIQGFMANGMALDEPETMDLGEAATHIKHHAKTRPGPVAVLGSGLARNRDDLVTALPETLFLPETYNHPSPSTMLRLAEQAAYSLEPIVPLYLRPCDAEENLPGIAAGLGLDPKEASLALKRLQNMRAD
jgi:tRNA threonylcarbamoyl adenosine modification protein YeaZ